MTRKSLNFQMRNMVEPAENVYFYQRFERSLVLAGKSAIRFI